MNTIEFNKLVHELNDYSNEILSKKGPEYTQQSADVLYNFKSTSKRMGLTSLQVWSIFFDKQVQTIMAHVKNPDLDKAESLESRFADVINYARLGHALFIEREKYNL